jgi:hypothetical protein
MKNAEALYLSVLFPSSVLNSFRHRPSYRLLVLCHIAIRQLSPNSCAYVLNKGWIGCQT